MPHTTHTPAWALGMQKIGIGMYVDANRALHISHDELCEYFDMPLTDESTRRITDAFRKSWAQVYPDAPPPEEHQV